jgi:hypothetical protein
MVCYSRSVDSMPVDDKGYKQFRRWIAKRFRPVPLQIWMAGFAAGARAARPRGAGSKCKTCGRRKNQHFGNSLFCYAESNDFNAYSPTRRKP